MSDPSLYERIGGKDAVNAAVDIFYEKVLADDSIKHFFDAVDMEAQRGKQKMFLAFVFGAPTKYEGKDMRSAHAALVERGLAEAHFGAVAGHLQATLVQLEVPEGIIAEVMAIAGSTHDDVLGITKREAVA